MRTITQFFDVALVVEGSHIYLDCELALTPRERAAYIRWIMGDM